MVRIIEGNLFDTKAEIICHQCNCQGVMGSGVAAEVKKRYPEVFKAYRKDYEEGKPVIAFPYLMSCHRGGGDWNVVSKMIEDTFGDFEVEIWRLQLKK